MRDSHFTCEPRSILTSACRKPAAVAFALHRCPCSSGTYRDSEDRVGLYLRGGMHRWLLAGALAFATASQALASDLPPPAPPPPPRTPAAYVPPVLPVYNWGGLYFGLNVGYGFGKSNWVDAQDPGGQTGNFNLKGFLAGPLIG